MATKTVRIGVEVDRETDSDFETWADSEGRSKRRHAAILLRNLTSLVKTHRDDLERLGLAALRPHPQN
jgi:hypothetical protein